MRTLITCFALVLAGLQVVHAESPKDAAALAQSNAMLQAEFARLAQSARAPGPQLYYLGVAFHDDSQAFMADTALGEKIARELRPDAVVLKLANPPSGAGMNQPFALTPSLSRAFGALRAAVEEGDIAFILLSSHGRPGEIAVNAGGQEYPPVRTDVLKRELDKLGNTPTVLVISSCYSGSLIRELAADNRIILTASTHDRVSFGCQPDSSNSYFIAELFRHEFSPAQSIKDAFGRARRQVEAREQAMGLSPPSDPQIFIGKGMESLANQPMNAWF